MVWTDCLLDRSTDGLLSQTTKRTTSRGRRGQIEREQIWTTDDDLSHLAVRSMDGARDIKDRGGEERERDESGNFEK